METEIEALLAPHEAAYPVACRVARRVAQDQLLRSAVAYLLRSEPGYIPSIAPWLDVLARLYASQGKDLEEPLEAVLEYTHLYMRHQVSFLAQGTYSNTKFDDVYRDVYSNEELMLGTYLPGLYLTQLFWPVHYRVLGHYQRFLDAAAEPDPARLLEFGVGHGMTLLHAKQRFPRAAGLAFDVSEHSLKFAKGLLAASGADASGLRFELADVTKLDPSGLAPCQLGTMGEILEHVEDPRRALSNFRQLLVPGAPAFITTVIDSNAIDHIYQFGSQAEIDGMIGEAGLSVERSEIIRPAELRSSGEPGADPTRYYFCTARAG